MEKIKRLLNFNQTLINGDTVRLVLDVFPDIKNKFRQRKNFDEYYFDGAIVELNIQKISQLNDLDLKVLINWEQIKII